MFWITYVFFIHYPRKLAMLDLDPGCNQSCSDGQSIQNAAKGFGDAPGQEKVNLRASEERKEATPHSIVQVLSC